MKIGGFNPKIAEISNRTKSVSQVGASGSASLRKDELTISGAAKDYQTVMKALRSVPDIRQEKVQPIQIQVDSGAYAVDAKSTADKLVQMMQEKQG